MLKADSMSFFCFLERLSMSFMLQSMAALGELLRVPSPEHGESRRILSKRRLDFSRSFLQNREPSSQEIIVLETPALSQLAARMRVRPGEESLAIINPLLFIIAAACVVFEPGAAHKSRKALFSHG